MPHRENLQEGGKRLKKIQAKKRRGGAGFPRKSPSTSRPLSTLGGGGAGRGLIKKEGENRGVTGAISFDVLSAFRLRLE